jgi:hypothetical protein
MWAEFEISVSRFHVELKVMMIGIAYAASVELSACSVHFFKRRTREEGFSLETLRNPLPSLGHLIIFTLSLSAWPQSATNTRAENSVPVMQPS